MRVAAQAADRVEIVARGFGPLASIRGVAAAVQRSALPYLPGALASDAPVVDLLLGPDWQLDGGAGRPPPLAVGSAEAADRLRSQLDAEARARLVGAADVEHRRDPRVRRAARRRGAARGRAPVGGEVGGALGEGLFVASGATRLRDVSGSGVLVVDGPLEIDGSSPSRG